MKKKLFGQNILPDCSYCLNSVKEDSIAYCSKKKVIKNNKCKSFKYDPLMRVPKSIVTKTNYSSDDFKI